MQITDFGSARILGETSEQASSGEPAEQQYVRRKNSFVGTAQFVSPEILQGKEAHIGTDLWSLACILFQVITGNHLFGGKYILL